MTNEIVTLRIANVFRADVRCYVRVLTSFLVRLLTQLCGDLWGTFDTGWRRVNE